jgi:hypothetical protein
MVAAFAAVRRGSRAHTIAERPYETMGGDAYGHSSLTWE